MFVGVSALLCLGASDESALLWHLPTAQLPCESSLAVDARDDILVVDAAGVERISRDGKRLGRSAGVAQNPDNFALSPSTFNGTTYVPGRDALVALQNGNVLWSAPSPGAAFTGSASVSHDGSLLYVGCGWDSDCEAVTALDARTGKRAWRFAPRGTYAANLHTVWAKPTVADDGTVLACDFGGHLFALDGRTGAERWRFTEAHDPTGDYANEAWASVALTDDGHLIFTSNLGWIRKLRVADGAEVRRAGWPLAPSLRAHDAAGKPQQRDPIIFSAPVVGADGTIYVNGENWCVYAISRDGAIKWHRCDFCSWGTAGMLLRADGTLVFGADLPVGANASCPAYVGGCDPPSPGKQAHLIVLDAATGARRWAAPIPGMRTFVCNEQIPNILSDGTLVVSGGTYGGVSAFRGGAPLSKAAAWAKYGADAGLSGRRARKEI